MKLGHSDTSAETEAYKQTNGDGRHNTSVADNDVNNQTQRGGHADKHITRRRQSETERNIETDRQRDADGAMNK